MDTKPLKWIKQSNGLPRYTATSQHGLWASVSLWNLQNKNLKWRARYENLAGDLVWSTHATLNQAKRTATDGLISAEQRLERLIGASA